jgi:hypothetical protein
MYNKEVLAHWLSHGSFVLATWEIYISPLKDNHLPMSCMPDKDALTDNGAFPDRDRQLGQEIHIPEVRIQVNRIYLC